MKGEIVSEQDGHIELLDFQGNVRTLWKRPAGFYLGENGRLYLKRTLGRSNREVEFFSIGRASYEELERYHLEKTQRTIKEELARDHLRQLHNDEGMTIKEIAEKYKVSAPHIWHLLHDFNIISVARHKRSRHQKGPSMSPKGQQALQQEHLKGRTKWKDRR